MMDTPAVERLGAPGLGGGYVSTSGVGLYKNRVASLGPTEFVKWRSEAHTVGLLAALNDLALHTPDNLSGDDRLVQFGVSQGLALAATLLADPSVLWPDLFTSVAQKAAQGVPKDDFGTSIDDALGK